MDIEILEALALDDRTAALARLVPGSEDHDEWTALSLQRRGDLDAVDVILGRWTDRHGDNARRKELALRQLLLRLAGDSPSASSELGKLVGARLDHAREVSDEAAPHPTAFDVDGEALLDAAIRRDRGLEGVQPAALSRVLLRTLDAPRRRAALTLAWRGGFPGLVTLLAADLGEKDSPAFGALPVHHRLTRAELDALATLVPRLRTNKEWILAHLVRARPPFHVDLAGDAAARTAWIDAMWAIVADLPPVFASLRAHVAYHRLVSDSTAGVLDRARLAAYLAMPRRGRYVRQKWLEGVPGEQHANLVEDFARWTGLPPVADDEVLVRQLVGLWLVDDDGDALSDFVERSWLDRLLAETRLLAGSEDPRWTRVLGPSAGAALRERVDLELLPTNPTTFLRTDPVVLSVGLKNAWPLRVRVFRINTAAHFASTSQDVALAIDLDGMTAGWEEARPEGPVPLRRVVETFTLAACDRPGTYVVEFVGNGRASRALVRKGHLRCASWTTPYGVAVAIFDESGRPAPDAWVTLGGREYRPQDGTVTLPFGTRGGAVTALLCDGELAVPTQIELPTERYALDAAILVDRQALVPGRDATVLVRVEPTVDGVPIPFAALQEPYVEINTVDRTGVPAQTRRPLALEDGREVVLTVPVPEHIARFSFAIGARVRVVSEQRTIDLRQEASLEVGTQHASAITESIVAGRDSSGWWLWLTGKNGEPRAGREVAVALQHVFVKQPLEVKLATDAEGRIHLGPLAGVSSVHASTASGVNQQFYTRPEQPSRPSRLVHRAGRPLVLPASGVPVAVSLIELRAGVPAFDHSALVRIDGHALRIDPLPVGAYTLEIDGVASELWVLPDGQGIAALATTTVNAPPPRAVLAAVARGEQLALQVENFGPDTRVHVIATPMWPASALSPDLDTTLPAPRISPHAPARSDYLSGRDLGDEARYVLDRRRLPRRPGSLLERPGLLLNPWALRTTQTATQAAKSGGNWGPPPAAMPQAREGVRDEFDADRPTDSASADPAFTAWDFLDEPTTVLANLTPDDDGRVVVDVPKGALRIVLVDPSGTHAVSLPGSGAAPAVRDLRGPALNPDRHLREDRRLTPLAQGAAIEVASRATTRIELADSVDALWRALCAVGGDAELAKWDFLPRWSSLSREDRCALVSKHGCHELALFVRFKDPELFRDVVRPLLTNKLHKTFLDAWLLDLDLSSWLVPWRLARLNAVERALLARRVPRLRDALVRELSDAVALKAPDLERDDRFVDVLLAGRAASGGGSDDLFGAVGGLDLEPAPEAVEREEAVVSRGKMKKAMPTPRPPAKSAAGIGGMGGGAAPLYRPADKTEELAENNWWHQRLEQQGPELILPARLWRDLAAHVAGPFLSPHVVDAAVSFAASVCALAVIDVPFAPASHVASSSGAGGRIQAGSPLLAASAELAEVAGPPTGEVLVGQSTFRSDDRFEWDGAEQREKYVAGELTVGVVYEGQVVITNPTSRTQRIAVLVQIPAGSLPVARCVATRTTRLQLAPWSTGKVETAFYFPEAGVFPQYGARITAGATLLAAAPDRTFTVVRHPTTADAGSWSYVSQRGSLDEVVTFLGVQNLGRVDLARVAWRLLDRASFERITAVLAERQVWSDVVWAYSLLHRDRTRLAEWLERQAWLPSSLPTSFCDSDPVAHQRYQHLEYAPLVNARAHALGGRRTVLNDGLDAQWRAFLQRVATSAGPTADDQLEAAHYLFAMDRPDDAIRALAAAPRTTVASVLQHDWLSAYAAAVGGDLAEASRLVQPYLEHPVPRWQKRFVALADMLAEAGGGVRTGAHPDGRDATMAHHAAQQPSLTLRIEDGAIVLDHSNLTAARVRFYGMDVELLFSRQPFLGAAGTRFTFIEPTVAFDVALQGGRTRVQIPADQRHANAVIEVVAGPLQQIATWFANDLSVTVSADYGQLQVRRASTGAVLPAAYVKCFARNSGGAIAFYKDGYTDLRGRLDYATLSTDALDRVERFALLVVHDDAGTLVVEAAPPTR